LIHHLFLRVGAHVSLPDHAGPALTLAPDEGGKLLWIMPVDFHCELRFNLVRVKDGLELSGEARLDRSACARDTSSGVPGTCLIPG
jgi:hypothetical protein